MPLMRGVGVSRGNPAPVRGIPGLNYLIAITAASSKGLDQDGSSLLQNPLGDRLAVGQRGLADRDWPP